MFDAQGVFNGYRGIDRDITERKEAEKERRASAEKLEQTLLQTIEAIAATVEARDPYTAGHQRGWLLWPAPSPGKWGLPRRR